MNISHFLDLNLGQWMTQKTTYLINKKLIYLNKSEITIKQDVSSLFLQHKLQNQYEKIISSYVIENNIDKDIKHIIKNINGTSCQLLTDQEIDNILDHVNKHNHISIQNIYGNLNSIERLWLVNPNLRLGINIVKKQSQCVAITFISDIKMI